MQRQPDTQLLSSCIDKDTLMVINDFRPLSDKSGSRGIGQSALIHRYEDFLGLHKHLLSVRMATNIFPKIPLIPGQNEDTLS